MIKCTGRGLVVKRPGVLSKVQTLDLVLGIFSLLPKFIFPVFRGEHINFLARLTLGQPAVCPRAIWTLTRAKSLCLSEVEKLTQPSLNLLNWTGSLFPLLSMLKPTSLKPPSAALHLVAFQGKGALTYSCRVWRQL